MTSFIDFHLFHNNSTENLLPNIIGNVAAKTLVLTRGEILTDEQTIFLSKILEAVKLHPLEEKVALLSIPATQRISVTELCRELKVEVVLLFGFENLQMIGLQAKLPYYHFIKLNEQHFLHAHALATIRQERLEKKTQKAGALWNALKNYYL